MSEVNVASVPVLWVFLLPQPKSVCVFVCLHGR